MVATKGRLNVTISSKNLKLLDELRFKNNKKWSRSAMIEKVLREFLEEEEQNAHTKNVCSNCDELIIKPNHKGFCSRNCRTIFNQRKKKEA